MVLQQVQGTAESGDCKQVSNNTGKAKMTLSLPIFSSGMGRNSGGVRGGSGTASPEAYSKKEHVDMDSIKTALVNYSHTDKVNKGTAYHMGFNDEAQSLIEKIAKGNYGTASEIAKGLVSQPNWGNYGASVSEKQAYVLAKSAFDNQLVKGQNTKGKTIFNYDARESAKAEAKAKEAKKQAKKSEYEKTYQKSSTKIESGSVVYDQNGKKATIEKVITASTGYVVIKYENGTTKKQMAFNLKGEDGNPLKKKKF